MVEQLTLNQLVTGSSPAPATTFQSRLKQVFKRDFLVFMRVAWRVCALRPLRKVAQKNTLEGKLAYVKIVCHEEHLLFPESAASVGVPQDRGQEINPSEFPHKT